MTATPDTISFWRGRLPHWEVTDGHYFVTVHLAGAIPTAAVCRIHEMAEGLEICPEDKQLRIQRQIFLEMENWLDRAESATHLKNPDVARMMVDAIRFRQSEGTRRVFEYVVMPNHVHLLIEPLTGSLKDALERFKRWTGHEAVKILNLGGTRFWQREWFDHWVRSPGAMERIAAYIRENPVKVGLVGDYRDWAYGSWGSRDVVDGQDE